MDEIALLRIPITNRERRKFSEDQERLPSENEFRYDERERDPSVGRFRSLRGVGRYVDRQVYTSISSQAHDVDQEATEVYNTDVSTKKLQQTIYTSLDHSPKIWIPIWLRRSTLCFFAILFLALIAALLVVWRFSVLKNGFYVSEATSHYAWTYGPTAILVLVVSIWRQVDYHCKSLTPWAELKRGPISASKSLLVDYISPLQLVAFVAAVKRGHMPVVISISGFALLKVIVIFSTGLLVLLPTTSTDDSYIARSLRKFDASSFKQYTVEGDIGEFPPTPLFSWLGNLKNGLPFPEGVRNTFAYAPVEMSNAPQVLPINATYSVTTDALVPNLNCETVDASIYGPTTIQRHRNLTGHEGSTIVDIYFDMSDGQICNHWPNVSFTAINNQLYKDVPERQLSGNITAVNCLDEEGHLIGDRYNGDVILYTVADLRYSQTILSNGTIDNSTITVANLSVAICKPSLTSTSALITNNTASGEEAGVVVSLEADTQNQTTIAGLSPANLTQIYLQAFVDGSNVIPGYSNDDLQFQFMSLAYGSQDLELLLDASKLKASAESTFSGIMSYYALEKVTTSADVKRTADVIWSSNRLHVNMTSLWIMVAGFATMFVLSVLLLFLAPGGVVPKDPSLIATNATVLARSTELNQLFQDQGLPNGKDLQRTLDGWQYQTTIATTEEGLTSFKIFVSGNGSTQSVRPHSPFRWWIPFTASIPMFILTITIPLVVIAVLEILQRKSDQDQGLSTVSPNQYTDLYIHYVPTLILLLVATLINALDFNLASFSPWSTLAKGDATGQRSVLSNVLGSSPPFALWETLRIRSWGPALSLTAATIASLFTIIVSGLYTVENVIYQGPAQDLIRTDSFRLQNNYNVSNDNGAATVNNMIYGLNLGYPSGTHDELALPQYSLGKLKDNYDPQSMIVGPFTTKVPALRANLRCEVLPQSNINVTYQDMIAGGGGVAPAPDSESEDWFVYLNYTLPESCSLKYHNSSINLITEETVFQFPKSASGSARYGGSLFDIILGTNSSYGWSVSEGSTIEENNPPDGCPSLMFVYGECTHLNALPSNITSLICYQEIQQVNTDLTFEVNSTVLDSKYPPVPDESSAVALPNPNTTDGSSIFNFRIQYNLEFSTDPVTFMTGSSEQASNTTRHAGFDLDSFFSLIINSTDQVDPASLVGPANQDNLYNAINHVYRRYMAQVLNSNMRDPPQGSIATNGTMLNTRQVPSSTSEVQTTILTPRLVQNKTSKIILQILLSISAVLALLAYILTSIRHVLPVNPCSIAGTMSLLAGSDMCYNASGNADEHFNDKSEGSLADEQNHNEVDHVNDREHDHALKSRRHAIVDGAEFMDRRNFNRVFASGNRYSMGWWREDQSKQRKRRFGVDIGVRPDGDDDRDDGRRSGFRNRNKETKDRPPLAQPDRGVSAVAERQ